MECRFSTDVIEICDEWKPPYDRQVSRGSLIDVFRIENVVITITTRCGLVVCHAGSESFEYGLSGPGLTAQQLSEYFLMLAQRESDESTASFYRSVGMSIILELHDIEDCIESSRLGGKCVVVNRFLTDGRRGRVSR